MHDFFNSFNVITSKSIWPQTSKFSSNLFSNKILITFLIANRYMIKPNDYELELYTGKKSTSIQEMAKVGKEEFIEKGIALVCISLGKDGAILLNENHAIYAEGMKVDVRGTAGAGDSMVSGIIYAIKNNASFEDVLRSGVAAATSSVVKEGTKLCDRAGYDKYFKQVKIKKLQI